MRSIPFLFALFIFASCNQTEKQTTPSKPSLPEQLTKEQTDFVNYWAANYNTKHAPLLCWFRNRHINKKDITQLDSYLKTHKLNIDFTDAKKSLQIKTELAIDTTLTQNIRWINDEDVSICNKVDPNFWDCFNRRYPIEGFYYVSIPLFSADQKWCLVSINYLSKYKKESFGGGRLYHLEKNKWEEIAFLSYWGKEPE